MIAYHIDRTNSLSECQTIFSATIFNESISSTLFGGFISQHGAHYLTDCSDKNDFCSYQIEFEYELIRRSLFPHCFSRFQSMFALKRIDDLRFWKSLKNPSYRIFEIEFDDSACQEYDASFLKGGPIWDNRFFWSPTSTLYNAINYWRGERSECPLTELLIMGSIFIKKEICLPNDFF